MFAMHNIMTLFSFLQSHASGKARWTGECAGRDHYSDSNSKHQQSLAISQDLSTHLEKLKASS